MLPEDFKNRVTNTFGNKGAAWLSDLPKIISDAEKNFNLTAIKPLPHLNYNYTTTAIQKNNSIVVKYCLPGAETNNEIDALKMMSGDGIIQLIDYDRKLGVLLLEQCQPGKMLTTVADDSDATRIAANIIRKIKRPVSDEMNFQSTADWFNHLNDSVSLPEEFPKVYLDRAQHIADELHHQSSTQLLLHGDLHHFNILSAQRQSWLAIDPKGVIGPAEYECGAFLRNPIPDVANYVDLKNILSRRIEIFADTLGFDPKVIAGWGYAQAVLAAVWAVDAKSDGWKIFIACANALSV